MSIKITRYEFQENLDSAVFNKRLEEIENELNKLDDMDKALAKDNSQKLQSIANVISQITPDTLHGNIFSTRDAISPYLLKEEDIETVYMDIGYVHIPSARSGSVFSFTDEQQTLAKNMLEAYFEGINESYKLLYPGTNDEIKVNGISNHYLHPCVFAKEIKTRLINWGLSDINDCEIFLRYSELIGYDGSSPKWQRKLATKYLLYGEKVECIGNNPLIDISNYTNLDSLVY